MLANTMCVGNLLGYGKHLKNWLLRMIEWANKNFYGEYLEFVCMRNSFWVYLTNVYKWNLPYLFSWKYYAYFTKCKSLVVGLQQIKHQMIKENRLCGLETIQPIFTYRVLSLSRNRREMLGMIFLVSWECFCRAVITY